MDVWNVLTYAEEKKGRAFFCSQKTKHHECFAYHSQDIMYVTLGFHPFRILPCRCKSLYPSLRIFTVERLEHGNTAVRKKITDLHMLIFRFQFSNFMAGSHELVRTVTTWLVQFVWEHEWIGSQNYAPSQPLFCLPVFPPSALAGGSKR